VTGAFAISLESASSTVKLLLERGRIVAEGAAALSVAAALEGRAGSGRVVCVVSGGNIDASKLAEILRAG
jgi:threonine dehydratase